jgi:hypothetical protein
MGKENIAMKITFKVENTDTEELVEAGSTSTTCQSFDDMKDSIGEVLEHEIEEKTKLTFARSMKYVRDRTFKIEADDEVHVLYCVVSGITPDQAMELESQEGELP